MKNFLYTLIILFTFNITQSQEENVGNGATYIAVDYIKTVPGKNYGEILNTKWKKLAEKESKMEPLLDGTRGGI